MSTERGRRAKERKRSRIVVNVDELRRAESARQSASQSTRRPRRLSRRGRRRLLLVAAVAGVVALAASALVGAWYKSYKRSPAYSLALLADAAQRDDRQMIDQLIDIDQVTQSLVPQVVEKVSGRAQAAAQQPGATQQQPGAPPPQVPTSVRRYVEANAGVLIPGAREAVREAVIRQVRDGVASRADSYPFFLTALGVRFAADEIREEGDAAAVAFKANSQPVELRLQRAGGGERWRVVGIRSDELATRIADNLSRGLPALGR